MATSDSTTSNPLYIAIIIPDEHALFVIGAYSDLDAAFAACFHYGEGNLYNLDKERWNAIQRYPTSGQYADSVEIYENYTGEALYTIFPANVDIVITHE